MVNINPEQRDVIQQPKAAKIFLEGPAGTGKTTVGVERMLHLMSEGVPGNSILVLVPHRAAGKPYLNAMNLPGVVAGGIPRLITIAGLSQRMVDLFWPAVAKVVGFGNPNAPPIFLNFETAQYFMAHIVRPLFDEGMFESVTMERNRIYGQILDNLNKAAVVGFPYNEIGSRLKSAWSGSAGQSRVYDDTQTCANLFRAFCLQHNLLDFSLQAEIFISHLWNSHIVREYLKKTYQHLIVDNIEEDVPITHDILANWLPMADSGLVIYDSDGGYRQLLGADPVGAYRLKELCPESYAFNISFVMSPSIQSLVSYVRHSIVEDPSPLPDDDPRLAISYDTHAYYTQMLDWVADQIDLLINDEGVTPGNIAIVTPILSDSLRFSIVNRLENKNIPVKTYRLSRSLNNEPATLCLITFAMIAHPTLGFIPTKSDFAQALMQSIDGMDLIRSQLLADIVYRVRNGIPELAPFSQIIPVSQERISSDLGDKYERLRLWLEEYRQSGTIELDYFISRFFGEILAQPGYMFHYNLDGSRIAATMVESIRNFRRTVSEYLGDEGINWTREYIELLNEGLVAAQYNIEWEKKDEDAVLVAPAHTFLISNTPVDYQFWIDIANRLWSERLYQPIAQPYVLSRNWSPGEKWTFDEELQIGDRVLHDITLGLLHRCKHKIYLGLSEYNEQGYEQRGPLLQVFHRIFQTVATS